MKIHGVGDGHTLELYTASYTGKLLYNARNRPIQRRFIVPRICIAIQLYSARVYSRAIQDTAYTLYSPIRRSSGAPFHLRFFPMICPVLDVHMHGTDGSLGSANGVAATDRGVTEASQGNSLAVTSKGGRCFKT